MCATTTMRENTTNDISCSYSDNDTTSIGYISIKDFAYENSNPLHYGYFNEQQDENSINNDDIHIDADAEQEADAEADIEADGEDEGKRSSIYLPNNYIINQKAIALYDFVPENDNELQLVEGDIIFINYKHGQGWLVAQNLNNNKIGLVPEEFVSYLDEEDFTDDDEQDENIRPFYLTHLITQNIKKDVTDDEWEDISNHSSSSSQANSPTNDHSKLASDLEKN
ncbi:hypothetical protein TBLA_0H01160 [Henningerozyma blattae CBS 6284]|uniref:SH3 domain-containing protein n=1 Tax=Henningerozyma blattae (strain ATCC 34711 / CBS 6284 / DSM 70876 / NBRC 10599 / NRRL Y-10934 / UCD 77-7) TaxID=1071380 RepID=I2H7Q2_HENB6|nr:hypothetical protein TBLA_0H01160 [Tetrapisispora blattae CBS 6284]CCH62404.1 hypothetical protein TBLA_0H01160 [Tetrapisispora blattae CBS 6284]